MRQTNCWAATFQEANCFDTDFNSSNCHGATFTKANLEKASFAEANISSTIFDIPIRRLDFGGWSVCIREDATTIGCRHHSNKDWLSWTPKSPEIKAMHSKASEWWATYGSLVKMAIRNTMKRAKKK